MPYDTATLTTAALATSLAELGALHKGEIFDT